MKEQLKVLACGSVDDGKSTLLGRLIYDTKTLYNDQIESLKDKNNNIDYSLLLDGLDEEREQAITIDVAYRFLSTDKKSFVIIDAPGHEEYTRNMAVGASQADLSILLIDATKGVTVQTKRHIKICMMMGIKDYVVAVNKMDLINYNKDIFEIIETQINYLFKDEKVNSMLVIPVSAMKGDNISKKSKNTIWYEGESLLKYLENIKILNNQNPSFIFSIQRVTRPNQKFRGFQGNVISGSISISDDLICLPSNERIKVNSLFNLDKNVSKIYEGQSVTITLNREIDISRGCILTNDENIIVSNKFDAKILWMDDVDLIVNNAYYIKIANNEVLCYIRKVYSKINIEESEQHDSISIKKNDIIICNIECISAIPITTFEYNSFLGSFIIIDKVTNNTCACGTIDNILLKTNNLFYHNCYINKNIRARLLNQKPLTIWFTGLSCSGKSTIANELDKMLSAKGFHTMLLDGDNIRLGINSDLGFSKEERKENIRRVAHISKLFNDAGLICITSFITPFNSNRIEAKDIIGDDFVLVYINTDITECERRDKKGLYVKAKQGLIDDFTGISSPYEEPDDADIVLYNNNAQDCALKIFNYIREKI